MTVKEFNDKYSNYLEKDHYGLTIYNSKVIDYLDKQFPEIIRINKEPFKYYQIKIKFGNICVYSNASPIINRKLEEEISKILEND